MTRPCFPEWCETGTEPHDDVCDNAPMHLMTKHEWIEFVQLGAAQAIDAYRFLIADGMEEDEAKDCALAEAEDASACYAGIGSCGRGWCQHG